MAKERQTQYVKGFDDAVEGVLQVIAIAAETYPRVPTVETLQLFMEPTVALKILDAISKFQSKAIDEISQRIAEGAKA